MDKKEICKFEKDFLKSFCWRPNLSNNDIISYRPDLKTSVKNFWSKIESRFGEPGGTTPPRISRSIPGSSFFFRGKRGEWGALWGEEASEFTFSRLIRSTIHMKISYWKLLPCDGTRFNINREDRWCGIFGIGDIFFLFILSFLNMPTNPIQSNYFTNLNFCDNTLLFLTA